MNMHLMHVQLVEAVAALIVRQGHWRSAMGLVSYCALSLPHAGSAARLTQHPAALEAVARAESAAGKAPAPALRQAVRLPCACGHACWFFLMFCVGHHQVANNLCTPEG